MTDLANNKLKLHFVSDIHLGSNLEPNFLLFKKYLENIHQQKVTHLFLLGDIFDYWVADRSCFVNRYKEILFCIEKLINRGIKVYYFEGNHDFHLKKFWQDHMGVEVFSGPLDLSIESIELSLAHGDEMDQSDKGYLRLRKFFRLPPVKLFSYIAPSWLVERIGEVAGNKSKGHYLRSQDQAKKIKYFLRSFAEKKYINKPYDYFIAGHFHIRDEYGIPSSQAKAINLGTWLEKAMVYEITQEKSGFIEP